MDSFNVRHEVRLLDGLRGKAELGEALAIYTRVTSQSLRTQTAQIQAKFERPDNPHGRMFYASLREQRKVIGFAMFGYYPRTRLVIVDHIAIDPRYREGGAFYVFASLLQDCIQAHCGDYDYVAVEVATDSEVSRDGINGEVLVRLLRRVGFGKVHTRYDLPGMDARTYSKPHVGTLMVRGAQPVSAIRSEVLLDLHHSILFEHYLPWFTSFLGTKLPSYRSQLERLESELRSRLKGKPTILVNGGEHDELGPGRTKSPGKVMGLERVMLGRIASFAILLAAVAAFQGVVRLEGRSLAMTIAVAAAIYLLLAAQGGGPAYRLFERFGGIMAKLISRI